MTTDSGMPAVKEVSNFISDALLIHVAFRYIITGTGTLYNKNSSGDEIVNVNFFYKIAHVQTSAYAH